MLFSERKLVRNLTPAEIETREILIREFLQGYIEPAEYVDAIQALYEFGTWEPQLFEDEEE